jgi:hypothetical protein
MYKEHKLELKVKALDIVYRKLYYMDFPEYYKGFMEGEEIEYIKNEIDKISENIGLKGDLLISKRGR